MHGHMNVKFVSCILFAVAVETVQNQVSAVSHVTPLSKQYTIHDGLTSQEREAHFVSWSNFNFAPIH
jgi:hypothetical protein